MSKKLRLFTALTAVFLSTGMAFGQVQWDNCTPNGDFSSSIGINNVSDGDAAFSSGFEVQAIGHYSTAFGVQTIAEGEGSFSWGLGSYVLTDYSLAFGKYVQSVGLNSFVLGSGYDSGNPLVNEIDNSIMIGFEHNEPTLFVGAVNGAGNMGYVGIGTVNPSYLLDVAGDINISGNYKINGANLSASHIGAEPVFSKNTAFNKNFGTTSGTVAQGDHSHTGVYEPANANIQSHISSTSNPHNVTPAQIGAVTSADLTSHTGDATIHFTLGSKTTDDLPEGSTNLYSQWGNATGGINYAGGNVGIGTTSPDCRLHIEETYAAFKFDGSSSTSGYTTTFGMDDIGLKIGHNSGIRDIQFQIGSITQMTILNNGKVGIGTTTPDAPLTVQTPNALALADPIAKFRDDSANRELLFITNNMGGGYNWISKQNDFTITWNDFTAGSGLRNGTAGLVIAPWADATSGIRIDANGNVGIGTSDPQSTLAVNGTITAKEVEVTLTGWPDYVFEENYNLKPLSELENYIKTHKHLPDVPSETEVKENGVNLGEMDAILLQKIEELTLYMIEQNKKIEELQKENAALKEKMEKTF